MDSVQTQHRIDELHVNLTGKLLLASIGAWLVGKAVNTRLRGSVDEIRCVANAMLATKHLHEELRRPGATVQSVMDKVHVKNKCSEEFERVMGLRWPL